MVFLKEKEKALITNKFLVMIECPSPSLGKDFQTLSRRSVFSKEGMRSGIAFLTKGKEGKSVPAVSDGKQIK